MNHSNTFALHIANEPLDNLKRKVDLGIDQFIVEASQAIINKDPGVFAWGWLDDLLERIAKVTSKPPYFLSCRVPLRFQSPDVPISPKNYIDRDHPERGMVQFPFATQIAEQFVEEVRKFDDLESDRYRHIGVYIRDVEANLPSWWTSGAAEFARQMITVSAFNVFHPKGKQVVGPGITIMEHETHKQRDAARNAFRDIMSLAGSQIDHPSVHSYARNGRDAGWQITEFARAVGFDLRKKNLWISETGQTKGDGEENQLIRIQDFCRSFNWTADLSDPDLPGVAKVCFYDSISSLNGLFRQDGTPTLAMEWLSKEFLQ